ncbi:hypothetical protein TURU_000803 [Turdus rufiventris]|nr:hypothetical protein TURU_000803 [Turdus rufiventris]
MGPWASPAPTRAVPWAAGPASTRQPLALLEATGVVPRVPSLISTRQPLALLDLTVYAGTTYRTVITCDVYYYNPL